MWVECVTAKTTSGVLDHYRKHKIYPDMHEQLHRGDRFELRVLAKPATLKVMEMLHTKFKETYGSESEVTVL
jgi:hypothetical protein